MSAIPRIGRDQIAEIDVPARTPRQVAHILTLLGFEEGDPVYHLECRASARDQDKACAVYLDKYGDTGVCRQFYPGCWLASDAEEVDDLIRDLSLKRGTYLLRFEADRESIFALEVLATIGTVGDLSTGPTPLEVAPAQTARYPGFGPEADLRDLIEEGLGSEPDSVTWDEDTGVLRVDASRAAELVWQWMRDREAAAPTKPTRLQRLATATMVDVRGELL
jgi:hypothetical protein